jgi:two-component system alkaline phosphatase synthesis response regulator PhoP
MAYKILVVDDDQDIVEFISYNLENHGYIVDKAYNGRQALSRAKTFEPHLILLDVMMPELDGKGTIRLLRELPSLKHTAIIFLTALGDTSSEIEGLNLGADDYITKPIKMNLLITRIQTALRKNAHAIIEEDYTEPALQFGALTINKTNFEVVWQQQAYTLARKEFELLYLLASKPNRVFNRQEILQKVWGTDIIVGDRTIDVHIRKIRQKLGIDVIKTVKGVGYKFDAPNP